MTRRLLAAASLAAIVTGGLVVAVAPPSYAAEDGALCIGGESQRKPNSYNGLCLDPRGYA